MSNTEFRSHIRASIENDQLQIALDNNTARRLKGRAAAFESIPDWRERRQRAHAIRADVIDHLEEYLNQFTSKLQENGFAVHRAQDAAEAIKIVLEIVEASPQKEKTFAPLGDLRGDKVLIAKSKSMVSEEINLNHALEKHNIKVVETDLGEYIVQLRGERPSHIITPAVHLRRGQVGQLFHEKLDIPYTEDIPTLTSTARKVLREVFLTADIGISGVNFGVADTGSICIVTNEGNGRMVTTLPPIHIALMGMERIVPNLEDLSLMLSLLPRSATGQKLSVYTQLIRKPLDNQQRHILLLDNGRSRLRNSPLKESLYCIRCGACLNACPVFRELGGHAYVGNDGSIAPYPGPIGSIVSPGLLGENFVQLAQASSLCGACKEACPVDIDLPKLLTRVRAGESPSPQGRGGRGEGGAGLSFLSKIFMRIYSRVARNARLFALAQTFASLTSRLVSPFSEWIHLPALTGWGYSKDFPRFAGKTFRERYKNKQVNTYTGKQGNTFEGKQVAENKKEELSLIESFTKELIALNGDVAFTKNPTQSIIEFLKAREINQIHLEPNALDEGVLSKAGIVVSREVDPVIRVGVTKAICGLADTGSILEADGEGFKLQASLLPEIHLAVLHQSDLLPSLPDAMKFVRDSKAAVFITGPSRTADIEMTLTLGVHGPKELHVFVVDG